MPKFLETARDKALVIMERERPFFTPGAMSMYILALIAEAPVIIARYLLALLIVFAVLVIEGNLYGGTEWALIALIPTAWSATALFNPTGGAWWWQTRAGGREPSKREQLAYQDAVELLQTNAEKPLPLPRHWFVIDSPQPDAAVSGDALMVSRGLLETNHLTSCARARAGAPRRPRRTADDRDQSPDRVLHSIPRGCGSRPLAPADGAGSTAAVHAASGDGRVRPRAGSHAGSVRVPAVLVHRLTVRERRPRPLAHRPRMGRYWRTREYHADQYAAGLGQADELADFLEIHALIHDNPIPFLWLTEHTHPPTELRIDRLRATTPATTNAAPDAESEAAA